ncbi:MAG TPA: NUDIX hydrolase N-terminal domain-containing protein [Mucilaginibacter sp.]|jgi:8-oxo-dGTP pyrophosphatase MutT (NUDIX family)|nr:NUDIX hydrolase N-terminal domain-containing protein [Mucilaginibacter sp.]
MKKDYLDLLDELRAIAQIGLNYSRSPYDQHNYERLLQLVSDEYAAFTGLPSEEIRERFRKELGYITPKIGVNGVLFDTDGRIFLEHRSDDKMWGIPGGWVDVAESPENAVKREFMEEADFVIEPLDIIKFHTRLPGEFNQPHTSIHIYYYCRLISGELRISHESLEMKFVHPAKVTEWHKDHQSIAEVCLQYFNKINAGR